jgi:hypothetical protein
MGLAFLCIVYMKLKHPTPTSSTWGGVGGSLKAIDCSWASRFAPVCIEGHDLPVVQDQAERKWLALCVQFHGMPN